MITDFGSTDLEESVGVSVSRRQDARADPRMSAATSNGANVAL